jgi:hypothetical protein
MLEEDKEKIQREKDQLLADQTAVKEMVRKELHFVPGLAQEEHEEVEVQVMKLAEAIQQLQARVMELELHAVPSTPQEVRDQREKAAKSAVERIKSLASECKQLSDISEQTYKCLTKDPELRKLEAQIDIPVSNYSMILGRDWKALTGGYLSLDGTHLFVPRNGKNIIVLREGIISPYIESVPQPHVNYLEEDLGCTLSLSMKVTLYLNQLI